MDAVECTRCGSHHTQGIKVVLADTTCWVSRSYGATGGLSLGRIAGSNAGSGWVSESVSTSYGEVRSGIVDILVRRTIPPDRASIRAEFLQAFRDRLAEGRTHDHPQGFKRGLLGGLVVDKQEVARLADAEYQIRLANYEVLQRHWQRGMFCLNCGSVYFPFLFDELCEEGERLHKAGQLDTRSEALNSKLTALEDEVAAFERAAACSSTATPPAEFVARTKSVQDSCQRDLQTGRVSPVALARIMALTNRMNLALFLTEARAQLELCDALRRAVEATSLTADEKDALLLRVDFASDEVELGVAQARRTFETEKCRGAVEYDFSAVERSAAYLDGIINDSVPVAAAYRRVTRGDKQLAR